MGSYPVHERTSFAIEDHLDNIEDTAIERYLEVERFVATTGFTGTTADVANIATTTDHVPHEDKMTSIEFDKTGGTVTEAGVQKTITSLDASAFVGETIVAWQMKVPDITNANYVFLRLGTDSSNYSEWQVSCDDMTSARWASLVEETHNVVSQTGTGCNFSAITYVAAGVVFDNAADTLNNILVGYCAIYSNPFVSTTVGLDLSTVVPNATRVQKFGPASSGNVPVGAGNVTNGTQRVTIATDDVNLAAVSGTVKTLGSGAGTTAVIVCGTDGTNARALKTDATGIVQTSGSADFTATHGATANTTIAMIAGKAGDGNAYTLAVGTDGTLQVSGAGELTSTLILNAATADNGVPTGTDGTALQDDTKDAVVEIWCDATITNADVNVWIRARGSAIWYIPSGGSLVDLQDETGDRWSVILRNVGLFADRVYVEVDNYSSGGSDEVSAQLIERNA